MHYSFWKVADEEKERKIFSDDTRTTTIWADEVKTLKQNENDNIPVDVVVVMMKTATSKSQRILCHHRNTIHSSFCVVASSGSPSPSLSLLTFHLTSHTR